MAARRSACPIAGSCLSSLVVADLANLTDLAPGARNRLSVEVPDDLLIDADEDQLSRVLVNLVRNAVQALEPGRRQRRDAARST